MVTCPVSHPHSAPQHAELPDNETTAEGGCRIVSVAPCARTAIPSGVVRNYSTGDLRTVEPHDMRGARLRNVAFCSAGICVIQPATNRAANPAATRRARSAHALRPTFRCSAQRRRRRDVAEHFAFQTCPVGDRLKAGERLGTCFAPQFFAWRSGTETTCCSHSAHRRRCAAMRQRADP